MPSNAFIKKKNAIKVELDWHSDQRNIQIHPKGTTTFTHNFHGKSNWHYEEPCSVGNFQKLPEKITIYYFFGINPKARDGANRIILLDIK